MNAHPTASPARLRRARALVALSLFILLSGLPFGCQKALDKATQIPGRGYGYSNPGSSAGDSAEALSFPGGRPSAREEFWVIATTRSVSNPDGPTSPAPVPSATEPNGGALCARVNDDLVPMPLKHTAVDADIAGYIASVKVVQQFHNPHAQTVEAIYVFPLPENAAVNEFVMTIGDRHIRGIIRERAEAERIYRAAKARGHVASLLTQERPNLFTQSVANLEPGRAIDVTLEYFHTLTPDAGWYEFVFPMVVGPRFNPAGINDGVGAVARDARGASGQRTEVSYLAPTERSGHDIALRVNIDGGVAVEETACRSHRTTITRPSPERVTVALNEDDTIPNKDFVLRYRLAGDRIKSHLLTHRDARGGFFSLMLQPPADLGALLRQPLELVFVLDCSGSMHGGPLDQGKAAIRRALHRLDPNDSFQIINFSERSSALGPRPLPATTANVQAGLAYLAGLKSDGPTLMIEGIKAALDFPHDPDRLRFVCFLTDGYIGNEEEIFGAVERRLGASRLFSFGVGSAPNRHLLDGLARLGRGVVAYVGLRDDAARVMEAFFDRVSHPALADVRIDWGGLRVTELFPARLPDLFVGRPVIVTGRFEGEPGTIHVEGVAGGRPMAVSVPTDAPGGGRGESALPAVWARMKIASLSDRLRDADATAVPQLIRQVALDYNLVSAFTAFVAVDGSRRTGGEPAVTIPVAVPVPEGVDYQNTVLEPSGAGGNR